MPDGGIATRPSVADGMVEASEISFVRSYVVWPPCGRRFGTFCVPYQLIRSAAKEIQVGRRGLPVACLAVVLPSLTSNRYVPTEYRKVSVFPVKALSIALDDVVFREGFLPRSLGLSAVMRERGSPGNCWRWTKIVHIF